jgi:hypothetical protein
MKHTVKASVLTTSTDIACQPCARFCAAMWRPAGVGCVEVIEIAMECSLS